ncbi:11252_t:CDS:1 [Funneliformis caledonium]|uniref:11252_t:CDS:1 n=1 Tax=Funneliformis caledonium TaxID=1117310 RepID=A0A9N9EYU2_9GLOM|nr:11252_t:CDS:1 [Funneliformis caledonium]
MEVYKSYYFETKHQRISSATYLRELLYSMFTILQATKDSYIPHPVPKFPLRPNISQRESIGYYIILTWQEIHGKLLQSLEEDSLPTWTLEELNIWWGMVRLLHLCLMELAFKNGWGSFFKHKADNAETLLKLFKHCEMSFKKDSSYANAVHISINELQGDLKPCNLEQVKGLLPVIEGKVLLHSQHDFNNLFGIEESFLFEGTKISNENLKEVNNLRILIGRVQDHIKPLMLLLQR